MNGWPFDIFRLLAMIAVMPMVYRYWQLLGTRASDAAEFYARVMASAFVIIACAALAWMWK